MSNTHKLKFRSNKSLVKLARDTIKASNFKIAYRDKYTADNMYFTDDQLDRIANGGDINITITPTSYEVRA